MARFQKALLNKKSRCHHSTSWNLCNSWRSLSTWCLTISYSMLVISLKSLQNPGNLLMSPHPRKILRTIVQWKELYRLPRTSYQRMQRLALQYQHVYTLWHTTRKPQASYECLVYSHMHSTLDPWRKTMTRNIWQKNTDGSSTKTNR